MFQFHSISSFGVLTKERAEGYGKDFVDCLVTELSAMATLYIYN